MTAPLGRLLYLYVGSEDVAKDVAFLEAGGGVKTWHFKAFGAEVAALQLGAGPLVLLADHRKAGTVLPIYEVKSLGDAERALSKKGWDLHDPGFETPDGPCRIISDPSGNEWAVLEVQRPGSMESAYRDARNPNAVR